MLAGEMLNADQNKVHRELQDFARNLLAADAQAWDIAQELPEGVLRELGKAGYFGAMLPSKYGGLGWGALDYGLLNEAIGAHSVSLTGVINVQTMVAEGILKWGTSDQRERWLPQLASGKLLSAFALSEPGAGSDIEAISTTIAEDGDDLVIDGTKNWITFGDRADLFLVIGKVNGKGAAALVERGTPGLETAPHRDMIGFRAASLGQVRFDGCRVPKSHLLGRVGVAFPFVVPFALDLGRLNIAFTALGMLRTCLELCSEQALRREAFGKRLISHGTISAIIADMGVDFSACEAVCIACANARDRGSLRAMDATMTAKYFVTRAASRHVQNAIQILGASGCQEGSPLARFWGDAKTMEIIEGSNQIHQMILGPRFATLHRSRRASNSRAHQQDEKPTLMAASA